MIMITTMIASIKISMQQVENNMVNHHSNNDLFGFFNQHYNRVITGRVI